MEHRPNSSDPAWISALAARIDRPVVLVGMMGVGKSSVGKRLAGLLGFRFVDADDEIEGAVRNASKRGGITFLEYAVREAFGCGAPVASGDERG